MCTRLSICLSVYMSIYMHVRIRVDKIDSAISFVLSLSLTRVQFIFNIIIRDVHFSLAAF